MARAGDLDPLSLSGTSPLAGTSHTPSSRPPTTGPSPRTTHRGPRRARISSHWSVARSEPAPPSGAWTWYLDAGVDLDMEPVQSHLGPEEDLVVRAQKVQSIFEEEGLKGAKWEATSEGNQEVWWRTPSTSATVRRSGGWLPNDDKVYAKSAATLASLRPSRTRLRFGVVIIV